MEMTILKTERLTLEPIGLRHYAGMREINTDPLAMRFLNDGEPESEEATRAAIDRIMMRWAEWGYSWWALIDSKSGEMVGAACLQHLSGDASQPLEIGWRLRRASWGKGYATEAAEAIVKFAFDVIGAEALYAVAHPENSASIKVMKRLGMQYIGIETHYEKPCVAYRLSRV